MYMFITIKYGDKISPNDMYMCITIKYGEQDLTKRHNGTEG